MNRDSSLTTPPFVNMLAIFAAVFFSLHLAYQASQDSVIETLIIDVATVKPSALLINQIDPDYAVQAHEHQLISAKARLSVLNGCEGTEMLFLVIAAIVAFRSSWRRKVIGLALGISFVYCLNQLRIAALYFSLVHDPKLFAAMHSYIGPMIIVLLTAGFYLWWVRWADTRPLPATVGKDKRETGH